MNDWDLAPQGNHSLGWMPGFQGKGFVHMGPEGVPSIYTWSTAEGGAPNHQDMLEGNMIPYREMKSPFDIDPEGKVRVPQEWEPTFNATAGYNLADLSEVDPRLRYVPESEWEDAEWDLQPQM